jgi:hypothetical protein
MVTTSGLRRAEGDGVPLSIALLGNCGFNILASDPIDDDPRCARDYAHPPVEHETEELGW